LRIKNAIVASCWTYFTNIKHDARNHKYLKKGSYMYMNIFQPPKFVRMRCLSGQRSKSLANQQISPLTTCPKK